MVLEHNVSTNNTYGSNNRILFQYDIVMTDNYIETSSFYQYFMNLAASMAYIGKVLYYNFFLKFRYFDLLIFQ
jgi:hypothetical protein